ncbi:het-domain protein [Fusarium beomiforme]|uniref:Het-domain protein n=1 Tax=Fusarium beomiforme TaxID=44412 RepID=A0A9P5ACV7_9HYPO|nr:het-domain protein [Fusarium beomiforme]
MIRLDSLGQTFRDAISITKRFGVEFLWIDCLCIIQDSDEDWRKESLLMREVYEHSYCNIAATASSDGRGGCFRSRDARVVRPCLVNMTVGGQTQRYQLIDFPVWYQMFERSPLNARAWVLQERLLSPRVLHFGIDQIVWECNELTACERYPLGIHAPLPKIQGPRAMRRFMTTPDPESAVLENWSLLVQAYSACGITKDTDRLIALQGIVRMLQDVVRSPFSSGLWMKDIERQLSWVVLSPKLARRPSEHIAPSWSWASLVGEVKLLPAHGDLLVDEVPGEGIFKVLDIEKSPGGSLTNSFVSHAQLLVRCFLVPMDLALYDWEDVSDDPVEAIPDDPVESLAESPDNQMSAPRAPALVSVNRPVRALTRN